MSRPDRLLVCGSCGIRFLDSGADQAKRQALGHKQPSVRCPGCAALAALAARRRGTVKWYDPRKGYGFIRQPGGSDIFVHRSGLARRNGPPPRKGQEVEFRVEHTDEGDRAIEVLVAGV
ncbi:MAG: cold shock domain-containing protein [Anaerolineae bacterium]|nr:cold shock domain-containing protein [Anaerolineae bacterium]